MKRLVIFVAGVALWLALMPGAAQAAIRPAAQAAIQPLAGCGANTLPPNDDDSTGLVNLGFTINFFGTNYPSLFVNNNGNVTFTSPLGAFTPESLVSAGLPIIAPFWADVDTTGTGSGVVTYGQTTLDGHPTFCVNWDDVGVGYFGGNVDKLN
jgi:hypothetical protein